MEVNCGKNPVVSLEWIDRGVTVVIWDINQNQYRSWLVDAETSFLNIDKLGGIEPGGLLVKLTPVLLLQ